MGNASLQYNDLLLLLLGYKKISKKNTEVLNTLFNVTAWFVVLDFTRSKRKRIFLLRPMQSRFWTCGWTIIIGGRSDHKLLGRIIRLYTTSFGRLALFLIFIRNIVNRKRLAAFFTDRSFAALSWFQKNVFRIYLHTLTLHGACLHFRKS